MKGMHTNKKGVLFSLTFALIFFIGFFFWKLSEVSVRRDTPAVSPSPFVDYMSAYPMLYSVDVTTDGTGFYLQYETGDSTNKELFLYGSVVLWEGNRMLVSTEHGEFSVIATIGETKKNIGDPETGQLMSVPTTEGDVYDFVNSRVNILLDTSQGELFAKIISLVKSGDSSLEGSDE